MRCHSDTRAQHSRTLAKPQKCVTLNCKIRERNFTIVMKMCGKCANNAVYNAVYLGSFIFHIKTVKCRLKITNTSYGFRLVKGRLLRRFLNSEYLDTSHFHEWTSTSQSSELKLNYCCNKLKHMCAKSGKLTDVFNVIHKTF